MMEENTDPVIALIQSGAASVKYILSVSEISMVLSSMQDNGYTDADGYQAGRNHALERMNALVRGARKSERAAKARKKLK